MLWPIEGYMSSAPLQAISAIRMSSDDMQTQEQEQGSEAGVSVSSESNRLIRKPLEVSRSVVDTVRNRWLRVGLSSRE